MSGQKQIGPIPVMGFGTWNRDGQAAYDCVSIALEAGYRHLDCAEGYNNEEYVGAAIAASGVARHDLFLTTKVAPESFGPGQIRGHVEQSLEKLRVDKVDLLLLHYPSINDEYDIDDYMGQFADIYDSGMCTYIGVSNFTKHYIDAAIERLGHRKLLVNQVEIHPFMQNRPIVDYCHDKSITTCAFSPLARGAVVGDPVLSKIAQKYEARESQIGLAFLMSQGHVVLPSSGSKKRITENFNSTKIILSDDDIARIQKLDRGQRLVNGPWCPVWDE